MPSGSRFTAGLVLAVWLAAAACACSPAPSKRSGDDVVVAEVDGAAIFARDVRNEILSMRGYSPSLETHGPTRGETAEALRRLVEQTLVLREGERRGVALPPQALEEEVMRFRADFPPGGLEKALLQAGVEPEAWRERLRRSLLYRRSADAIAAASASVTRQEVEAALRKERRGGAVPERIRVRQYLFETEEMAAAARGKLRAAGPAAGVPGEPPSGGVDLGFFGKDELPPEFPPGLFSLPAGEVSRPVAGEGGVSLFLVVRREPARTQTMEEDEARIRETLLAPRREAAFSRWLSRVTSEAKVKVHAGLLRKQVEENR